MRPRSSYKARHPLTRIKSRSSYSRNIILKMTANRPWQSLSHVSLFLSVGLAGYLAFGADDHVPPAREAIEWCDIWISHANETNLPRVLLIGDSIARDYYPEVEKQLAGKAFVARLATS